MSTTNDHTGTNYRLRDLGQKPYFSDLYDEGWEFHDRHWPDEGPCTPTAEAMKYAPYSISDFSAEADAYWGGYEDAAIARVERGYPHPKETAEDIEWAKQEIKNFILGQMFGNKDGNNG